MDTSTAPAGKCAQITLIFKRIRVAIQFETVKILARAPTLLATKLQVRPSSGIESMKSGLRGTIVSLVFAMSMMSLPVSAMVRTADPINRGVEIPGQSAGAFPPVPDALWLLGLVLIALIIIARRRFK